MIITMGDAAGIGPEIVLKSIKNYYPQFSKPIIIGSLEVFQMTSEIIDSKLILKKVKNPDDGDYDPGVVNILDIGEPSLEGISMGEVSSASGKASFLAVQKAHQMSLDHNVKAIISAPIHKQAMKEAGYSFVDETQMMSHLTGSSNPIMLLISDSMRMGTIFPLHLSLKEACENVSAEKIFISLQIIRENLQKFNIPNPIIAVAALNPHGGEGGILGTEEITEIIPGIKLAKEKGWDVRGPFPADTLFYKAVKGEFDGILTMYHDQGRIAMKTSDFGKIIIAMIGVPVPFLTVAHGTAHDIAGKGIADPSNFIHILKFADKLKQ